MRKIPGFRAIDQFSFNGKECFLSGLPAETHLTVFPDWLLDRYDLRDKPFGLLDERMATYGGLRVPCHPLVKKAADMLEQQLKQAFNEGYQGLKKISEHELFLWAGKLVLGLVYREFEMAAALQPAGTPLDVSPSLLARLSNLQLLMQSLFRPVELEHFTPWSVILVELEQEQHQEAAPENGAPSADAFSYNDEINTLIFSMEIHDAALIVCLQDNGENKRYHRDLLHRIEGRKLRPVEFRELCARFYYSGYLFNRVPQYLIYPPAGPEAAITIESMPLQSAAAGGPLFNKWDNKVYAQVLETFWKPWEISRFEILKKPESPLSFLPA